MSSIYSVRFILNSLASTWVYWTCPSGMRAVIRSISFASGAPAGSFGSVSLKGYLIAVEAFQATNATRVQDVRHVAYGGEVVGAYTNHKDLAVCVSGYLFSDPAAVLEQEPEAIATPWPEPTLGEPWVL